MARNRMIRPEFWEDSKMAKLSHSARLFFIGMWNFADDEGYLPNDHNWLKLKIFGYEDLKVSVFVNELLKLERIEIKNEIIKIKNFLKYQMIQHPTPSVLKNDYNNPHESSRGLRPKLREVKIREVKISKDKIREVEVKERIVKENQSQHRLPPFKENKSKAETLISQSLKVMPGSEEEVFAQKKQKAIKQLEAMVEQEKLNG